MLAITICATSSYTYAMGAQARRVAANVIAAGVPAGYVILVGDGNLKTSHTVEPSARLKQVVEIYKSVMPEGWKITCVSNPSFKEGGENYKEQAQLLIAAMREEAFAAARKFGADLCWSLDSDVLPPPNALRCSMDMLRFDGGTLYAVAQCPYPNGMWLGGRGTYTQPIMEDFLPHERFVPWKLQRALAACEKRLRGEVIPVFPFTSRGRATWVLPTIEHKAHPEPVAKIHAALEREQQRIQRLREKLKECPPSGNVWEVTAKYGWRRRGWMDFAYPGIGFGAVVPSDWCGFGCTLLNKRALELASFEGYDGRGTEDLFVVWRRWTPAGLRICCIPHCPCSHVIWQSKKLKGDVKPDERAKAEKEYVLVDGYHEPEGECAGHLRTRALPWIPER